MSTLRLYDEIQVRKEIKTIVGNCPDGLTVFAKLAGVNIDHLADVIVGNAAPSTKILEALGLMRVTRYAHKPAEISTATEATNHEKAQ